MLLIKASKANFCLQHLLEVCLALLHRRGSESLSERINTRSYKTKTVIDCPLFRPQCMLIALPHLSDLLTHQREQPDVKQHLPDRGGGLEVDHKHHSKQEEEGEVRHDIPVKLDLRSAVQARQSGPAAQRLQALQDGVTVDRKITGVKDNLVFACLTG